jgi:hypothetical protein
LNRQAKPENYASKPPDKEQISNASKVELESLKKSITSYLKSTKIGKRSLTSVLKQINEELISRDEYMDLKDNRMEKVNNMFLGKKVPRKLGIHEVEIPSFFNDKNVKQGKRVGSLEKPSFKST